MLELMPRPRRLVAPGVVHVPGWLDVERQTALAEACREWARRSPGARRAGMPNGARMSVSTNFYNGDARLGMHQDREELAADPVVSLSLGAACVFRVAGTEHRGRPWKDLELCSGDLVVFGRENRLAFHGVPNLLPDHDVSAIGLERGTRINITLRVSGLGRP